ncbi:MAG: hypothetical protein ACRBHB_09435 [Arenicella sp.]
MMGQLTFRTVFGGPEMPRDFEIELRDIKGVLRELIFEYELDLCLTVGADMIHVTHPTGLRSPRIQVANKRVTGHIWINDKDTMRPKDHRAFLRQVIHTAVSEIFDRMETKKVPFSKINHLKKIAFLLH